MEITAKSKTLNYCYAAMMAAVLAVTAQISIPTPFSVPLTLQTFAVALCGYLLGWKYGTISISVYLALGAFGVPVFSMWRGGIGMIVGYTGGFLWGFIPFVLLCGFSLRFYYHRYRHMIIISFGLLGLLLCHCFGIMQFSAVLSYTFIESAKLASLPFLIKDIASVVLAFYLSTPIKKAINSNY